MAEGWEEVAVGGSLELREPRLLRSAGDNARTRRSGSDRERRRGSLGQRKRARADGVARPSAFQAPGIRRACAGLYHLRLPLYVPGLEPTSFLRGWIAYPQHPPPGRGEGLSGTGRLPAGQKLRSGAGSNTSVGRPLPPEGRRLRKAPVEPDSLPPGAPSPENAVFSTAQEQPCQFSPCP